MTRCMTLDAPSRKRLLIVFCARVRGDAEAGRDEANKHSVRRSPRLSSWQLRACVRARRSAARRTSRLGLMV